MARSRVSIIDFHSHYFDADWQRGSLPAVGSAARVWPLLTDVESQLEAMADAGIDGKVLTAPTANQTDPGQSLQADDIRRINDRIAELAGEYSDRLLALGTIDAFQGDVAAREVERVVGELRFGGVVVDCAQGDRYLDDPQARTALEAANALRIAVFIHPVSSVGLTERLSRFGSTGVLMARGTENAVSILALLRGGVLDQLSNMRVVLPALGAAALIFAGLADRASVCTSTRWGLIPH